MEHCPIDNIDMTVLLGNCLENAITSCDDIKGDIKTEKFIRLNIKTINSTLAILMENSCNKVLDVYKRQRLKINGEGVK